MEAEEEEPQPSRRQGQPCAIDHGLEVGCTRGYETEVYSVSHGCNRRHFGFVGFDSFLANVSSVRVAR